MMRLPVAFAVSLCIPAAVFAQGAAAPPSRTPLVLERVESGFVVAPDYKVTELDGEIAHLAGGYAGWLAEDTLLIGGALYTVANGSDDFKMTYGGLLVGWTTPPERRIQFGARGLVGAGRATLGSGVDVTPLLNGLTGELDRIGLRDFATFGSRFRGGRLPGFIRTRVEDDNMFVFEPQLTLVTKVTDHLSVTLGAGYRFTGAADRLQDRLNGAACSLGLQLGSW